MSWPVGTVVIGQNFVNSTYRNGMEGVITEGLAPRRTRNEFGVVNPRNMTYRVRWADGYEPPIAPPYLRKKQPPSGEQSIMDLFSAPVHLTQLTEEIA